MKQQVHILNGDALKEQFPAGITGTQIVARECLVDGDVKGETLKEFFQTRASFIAGLGLGEKAEDYYQKVVPEFEQMQQIPEGTEINLWFEDDLFCQVNCWFVSYLLLQTYGTDRAVFLVRPPKLTPYGFGALTRQGLQQAFKGRLPLIHQEKLALLWVYYRDQNTEGLRKVGQELQAVYPFILPAVEAYIASLPTPESLGRPKETLLAIMKELNTREFGLVFREFCQRGAIYGFGDLQVKRLYDELIRDIF
ncbi:DUF1835 domain-containing protein [Algivirga pacifica]|uniref:DUF1835 domain-containing protein n=1 Tax=Algivirga pacifica TaxID=1162670 RepID=A0ABP9DLJ1_9BACT